LNLGAGQFYISPLVSTLLHFPLFPPFTEPSITSPPLFHTLPPKQADHQPPVDAQCTHRGRRPPPSVHPHLWPPVLPAGTHASHSALPSSTLFRCVLLYSARRPAVPSPSPSLLTRHCPTTPHRQSIVPISSFLFN